MDKPFHIYRSSAGSGKTRTLAREYILLALRHPDYFKYILAVTFANKATQEMKDRVIRYLGDFKEGMGEDLAIEIRKSLGLDAKAFRQRSEQTLSKILHQYSQFSISTIDAFFQRVIRAFTRESGLLGNFRLEVENELVLNEVIAELMDELGATNPQLTDWVIQFSRERLTEGESWNMTDALKGFSREIFKDSYKEVQEDIQRVQEKISFPEFLNSLRKEKAVFTNFMKSRAQKALSILEANAISFEDFKGKDRGTAFKYFREFAIGRQGEVTKTVQKSLEDAGAWPNKESLRYNVLKKLAEQQLIPLLREMIQYAEDHIIQYNSADLVEKNFYYYGLISDIGRKLKDYKAEHNVMLLADASHFLNGVIHNSDTPFIYEKVGSFYRHYLMDEFQDTSGLQWKNFQPLLREALDQNNTCLVVGDVKQSIYRWRGSDLGLLQHDVAGEIGLERAQMHVLGANWRSAENIVRFNNTLFTLAAKRVSQATGQPLPAEAFKDLEQQAVKYKGRGSIRIQFLEKWYGREDDNGEDQALQQVPIVLEQLQSQGIPLRDIAILVRKNEEGQRIATHLLQYKNSPQAKSEARYDVVSNESLRLDKASSVLLLVSALRHLNNPADSIARGELVYEYDRRAGSSTANRMESRFAQAGRWQLQGLLPQEFIAQSKGLIKLSLFELTETLIRLFKLGEDDRELTYLQSFQDLVLEFVTQEKNDIASFLEWWEEMKTKRSIQVAANTNAVTIFSIHKAKGMQFKYVIIPFCSWKMDHEIPPLLWCKSDEKPFDELGYMAVRYAKDLEKSIFDEEYRQEFTKSHLDNLNLLYVAFTRAEEGMTVIAPRPATKKEEAIKVNNVGQLLYECIQQSEELRQYYDDSSGFFSFGKIETLSDPGMKESFIPVRLEHYPSYDWRKKLVIRREGGEFFLEEKTDQRQRINYGMLLHKALSRIHYKKDAEEVLNELNFEGVIMEKEAIELKEKVKSMMNHPVIGNWFSKEWHVRTEVPVIVPGSQSGRLDRVIFKEVTQKNQVKKKAIIVDYKTGAKKKDDRKQVEEYAHVLSQMGYVDVEGFLLYLDKLEIVLVVDKMNLSLF